MRVTLILPRWRHQAIEERYARWQSELQLRRAIQPAAVLEYESGDPSVLEQVTTELVLVVTDPLLVMESGLLAILERALTDNDVDAAVPRSNESHNIAQQQPPHRLYLTLRQFEDVSREIAQGPAGERLVSWDGSDPVLYLARTASIRATGAPLETALAGLRVAVASSGYVHRYSSHRGQLRLDLLDQIDSSARSILEFGCGEGALGEALKKRQQCRVVGIELDPEAGVVARERLDAVLAGDVRELVETIDEQFDWIVGGDILEHLDEPWTFLGRLKRVTRPGGRLLLSLPNISSWPIVEDLIRGRFDYVYMGILCAGHVRFFTRQTIQDMLEVSGWGVVAVNSQPEFMTPEGERVIQAFRDAGLEVSERDLATPGYYVIAENRELPVMSQPTGAAERSSQSR